VRFGETWSHGGASIAFAAPEAGSRIAMLLCPVDSFVTRGAAQNRDAADSLVTFSKGCRTASQRRIMTDKLPRTRTEFEALVLAELHATSQCHGAVHVTVVAYDDYRVPATWEVASCGAGTSPPEECGRALCDVVGRVQQRADEPTSGRVSSARSRASSDALCARTSEWPRWPLASLASAAIRYRAITP
jgi:hypothetical protein